MAGEDLGVIGVGIKVDFRQLDPAIASAKRKIEPLTREHVIPFKVGQVNVTEVKREIDKITRGQVKINLTVGLSAGAGRLIHRELTAQMKAAGPVKVQISADMSRTQILRMKREVEIALRRAGGFQAPFHPGSGTTGGGGAGPIPRGPTPSSGPGPTPRAAPVPPQMANEPATPVVPTASPRQRASRGRTAREAHVATAAPSMPNFGGTPTGPAQAVTYRTRADGTTEVVRPPRGGGVYSRTAKQAARREVEGVSPSSLTREKTRHDQPETESELEYASRPTAVHLPLDEQARFEEERRGRGVRGASRSGARRRGERVLTSAEKQAIGDMQDVASDEASAAADERVRGPSRKSGAYFGSTKSPAFQAIVSKLQFYRFDPVLGRAFAALEGGSVEDARALLTGFSAKLAGADPKQRKKFFRLFRNTENVPPELLEKHAALQGLFAEIHRQVDPDYAIQKSGRSHGGGGRKAAGGTGGGQTRSPIDLAIEAMNAGTMTREEFQNRFPLYDMRRREGGGPVHGAGGLSARLAAARAAKAAGKAPSAYYVGERGPEVFVPEQDGEIIPTAKVPEWIRRGMAKDLTGRATGGPVRGYGGRAFRSFAPGEKEALAGGLLNRGDSTSVQRVFVVNWPGGAGFASNPAGAQFAAGHSAQGGASATAQAIGSALSALGFGPVTPNPAGAAAAGGSSKPEKLSPEQLIETRIEAVFGAGAKERKTLVNQLRADASRAVSQAPVRGAGPALGQVVAGRFGREELLRRIGVSQSAIATATKAQGLFEAELQKELRLRKQLDEANTPEAIKDLTQQVTEQAEATNTAAKNFKSFADEAVVATKAANEFRLKAGVFVGNMLGLAGGVLLFGGVLGAAQLGITAIGEVLGPAIERMIGFQNVSAGVTKALAEQTRQQGGAVQTTVAAAAAQAGLSDAAAKTISPLLQQRAAAEAGNLALRDGLDLLHSYEAVQRQNAGRTGDKGLTSTTGGSFGTIIGGIPSTSEQVANELANVSPVGRSLEQQLGDNFDIKDLRGKVGIDTTADRLAFFNDAIKKGGAGFEFVAQSSLPELDEATRELSARAADMAGAFDIANNIRDKKTILLDSLGNVATSADAFTETLQAINKGFSQVDPDLLIKTMTERAIPAARDLIAAQGQFQRGAVNPAQFALQSIATPTPGTTGGPAFGAGIVGVDSKGKVDAAAKAAADAYETQVGGAVTYVNNQIAEGRRQLINLVPSGLRSEFSGLLDDIESTGKAISDIQLGVQQQQTNLQVDEYNNQLRIARRSLQDAKDLQAGIAGETRNTLGGIEGQNIAIQRQLQLLGFELQQRQINFRLATAGFVAPGTTPEERAARIEAAKAEAAFAQKQLDLQKQLAANEIKGVNISAGRNVTDLQAQIDLLERGRSVTINTAAASRALDILNKKQSLLVTQAGTYIEQGVKVVQSAMEAASEVQKQTGKAFTYVLGKTAEAWGIFGEQAQIILNTLTGAAPKRDYVSGGKPEGYASGIVGDTLGSTQITVGEAAGEKVAILKNPKLVPTSSLYGASSGGSSSGPMIQMTVVISGNSVRSDTDLEELAERVAVKTEEKLMRKTSLFGLRRA